MTAARMLFVVALWPFVYAADRVCHINPPATLREGLSWAMRGAGPPRP
ncbi:hypothetical protein ACPPVO_43550 [Dactylosporangium sp. McL0621]